MAAGSAQLRLRGGDGPLRAQLMWPAAIVRPVVLVLLFEDGEAAAAERVCRSVTEALGIVSLSAACEGGDAALEWTADHAPQLGAPGARLIAGGIHAGAAVAAALALRARDDGWPELHRQVLLHPRFGAAEPAPPLAGVAPAIVAGGDDYAARLRAAGVPVQVLNGDGPRLLTDLAEALA